MITLTESAISQVKKMREAEEDDGLMLRIGVKGGGCTGLSYGMGFESEKSEDDTEIVIGQDLKIIIDAESVPLVEGLLIDYKQNMMGGGFTIDNPNAIASCGCGASFRTATNAGAPGDC